MYNFDIQKNCKSLKDLEKLLEILAAEISDEYRKHNKQSTVCIPNLLIGFLFKKFFYI